jgi:hypothetical protein
MTTKTNNVAESLRRLLSEQGMETLMEEIRRSEEEHKDSERIKLESGMFHMLLRRTVQEETRIEKLCKEVLPAEVVNGDSFSVPGPDDLVELLVEEIKRLRRREIP